MSEDEWVLIRTQDMGDEGTAVYVERDMGITTKKPAIKRRPLCHAVDVVKGGTGWHACSRCGHPMDVSDRFCRFCGAEVER